MTCIQTQMCDWTRRQEVREAFYTHKPQEKLHCLNNRKIQVEIEKDGKEIRYHYVAHSDVRLIILRLFSDIMNPLYTHIKTF